MRSPERDQGPWPGDSGSPGQATPEPGPSPGAPPSQPPAQPPARPQHRWGLGAYALAAAVFLSVSALLGLLVFRRGPPSVAGLAVGLAVPTVLAAATAILSTVVRGNGPRRDLGLRFSWRDVGLGLAFGFGGLVLTIPASLIYARILGPERATSAVGEVFAGLRAGAAGAAVVFVIVVLLAPLCEEIVYRGLLWGALEKHGADRWLAFALTTVLFALAHFEFTRTPLLAVIAIPIGLARVVTGRLTASIIAHQINNLLPGIALLLTLLGVSPI